MSYTFTVRAGPELSLRALLAATGYPDLRVREGDPPERGWPEGYVHVSRAGVSTREVELSLEDAAVVSVRLMSCSAPEDYVLGLDLVRLAAETSEAPIEPEDGGVISAREFGAAFDAGWIDAQVQSGARVARFLARDRGPIQLGGPVRTFSLGPRLLGELEAGDPDEREFTDGLLAAMRRTQYVSDDYWPARAMRVSGDDTSVTIAVWPPECSLVLPPVDYVVVVRGDDDPTLGVPPAAVPLIAGDRAAWLDEDHLIVGAFGEREWPDIVARARLHEVDTGLS